jgi:NADPH2:quinone reductase
MKAAFIRQVGPPNVIEYGELPDPKPTGRQVLVEVRATSVNPIDTYIRAGVVPMAASFPFVVGCDLAGVVRECGPDATRFAPGARVWGSNQGLLGRQGVASELAAVEEEWLYPLPESVDFRSAAAGALVGITAHLGLFRDAKLRHGEIVYVSGGSGGVGSSVIQLAHTRGARVVTTAGDAKRAAYCRELGADGVIVYAKEDVAQRIRDFAPGGVDVWFETRRDPDFLTAVPLLAPRGRFILMAGREARPIFPVGPFYTRDCKLLGFAMFNATPAEQRACADDLTRWLESGLYKPRIDRELPLAEAAQAHRLQEDNTLRRAGTLAGKIVLVP